MNTIQIEPVWIEVGGPALAAGLLLGAFIAWLVARSRRRQLDEQIRLLETQVKDQDALQLECGGSVAAATAASDDCRQQQEPDQPEEYG